jgi:hypothetical protein
VFTTTVGTPYESHNLRRDFRKVTATAGLGARWVPKELRTSFVSTPHRKSRSPVGVLGSQLGYPVPESRAGMRNAAWGRRFTVCTQLARPGRDA